MTPTTKTCGLAVAMTHWCWARSLIATLVVLAGLFQGPSGAAASADDAKAFVVMLARDGITLITEGEQTAQQKFDRFRSYLDTNFALNAIAKFALGRHWRLASDEEREAYLALFRDYVALTYFKRFSEYSGETVEVSVAVELASDTHMVRSQVIRSGGRPGLNVAWRVVQLKDASYKVFDVIIEGVSMSQTQRSEFNSVIGRNGNRVSALLDVLRNKTSELQQLSGLEEPKPMAAAAQ